jgi:AraC family transcriptional regulator, regulatory protein of adaptative response / DNA-3-methyladenine glycosylase II
VVRRALRLIEDGFLDEDSVESLATRVGIGARHLNRLFLQHVGASPVVVAQTQRLHFAKRLLDQTRMPIIEVALASGYGSVRRFNSSFQKSYRRAPREFRRRGQTDHPLSAAGEEVVLKLPYRPPYDWAQVRDFFAARALPGVERVDASGYTRAVALPDGHAIIGLRPLEGEDALELRVRGAAAGSLLPLTSVARRVFDVAADPARIALAFGSDPRLSGLVKRRPGLRIPGAWDAFECAVRAILGQQVSVQAGRTLASRVVSRIGRPIANGREGLTHLFPTPDDLLTADLRGLGMTTGRALALRELARAVAEGDLTFEEPVEDILATLTRLPGIGDWTAQYVALRALNEPDAFPASDLVLRRKAAKGASPLSTRDLEDLAEAWRPWRGYAAVYLWNA